MVIQQVKHEQYPKHYGEVFSFVTHFFKLVTQSTNISNLIIATSLREIIFYRRSLESNLRYPRPDSSLWE